MGEVTADVWPWPLWIPGRPAPQGSKRGFVVKGRAVLVESSKAVAPWRNQVVASIMAAGVGCIESGPVMVAVEFYLPRPKSESKRRVTWPDRRPDLDKLCRSLFDALTDSHCLHDDGQVVRVAAWKYWADERGPGALLAVRRIFVPSAPAAASTPHSSVKVGPGPAAKRREPGSARQPVPNGGAG